MFRVDRRLLLNFDWILLLLLLFLCGMALFNLYSASYPPKGYGLPPYMKQSYFYLAGCCIVLFILLFDYKILHIVNYPVYIGILLLLAALFVVGLTAGGAQRWIDLGFFRLQPSEPAKLIIVITLASYYSKKEVYDGYTIRQLIMPAILTGIPFALILIQPDLGTALMLAIIFVSMTVFVRLRISSYLILGGLGVGGAIFAWNNVLKPYQKQRIQTFLNPEHDPSGHGYQILQSKIAVGSGGEFGKGYLKGTQGHLSFLPERHTDFAFSVWCEEWGFVGSAFFLTVYFLMLLWGLRVAMNAKDRFGMLLAYGVVMLIFWQAIINILMVLGFLPVVGIPLPLVSYGGSSLFTTLAAIAILLNVSMRSFPRNQGQQSG